MAERRRFIEYVRELRAQEKIPRKWAVSDLKPFLKGLFAENTIRAYPYNLSISPDGKAMGDAVKRGMKPQFYRVDRGRFVLVEEFPDSQSMGNGNVELPEAQRKRRAGDAGAVERRLSDIFSSKEILLGYAGICAKHYRPHSAGYCLYHEIVTRHRFGRIDDLVRDDEFLGLAYKTLEAWDMNYRRARLVSIEEFRENVRSVSAEIISLSSEEMSALEEDKLEKTAGRLERIFGIIKVMESKSQIVGGSKTLHFLLPRLVMPIDGKYTLQCLYGYRKYQVDSEARLFNDIFRGFYALVRHLKLSRADEQVIGWNTTVPKIVDNAIIGFMKSRR